VINLANLNCCDWHQITHNPYSFKSQKLWIVFQRSETLEMRNVNIVIKKKEIMKKDWGREPFGG